MAIAFFILLFLVLLVLAIDIFPQAMEWQSRIKIGRWQNRNSWSEKVLRKSVDWLKSTPAIKLRDNKRLIVIDMIRGNYSRKSIQHWQQASLFLGLSDAYRATKDEKVKSSLQTFFDSKIDANGWKEKPSDIDSGILGYAFLAAEFIDIQRYRKAFDQLYDFLLSMKGADGTLMYRKHTAVMRYVDTIGFVSPFLVRYGVRFNNEEAITIGCKQILEFNKSGMYANEFIPCHSYNIDTKVAAGLFGWGRGLGWYAIGLIDAWRELPAEHPMHRELSDSVVRFAKMAMKFQNKKGGWNWLIMNPNSVTESSATATLAYFLSHASVIEEISVECRQASNRAFSHLMKVTKRDGAIDLCQGDTKDIGVYSQEFGILPFAQGFALRAHFTETEIGRL